MDVMPIFHNHCLDILITMRSSINCSAVICSPTVIILSWEKPLVKPMAPGSILQHISFPSTCQFLSPFPYFTIFYFLFRKPKIPKILLYRLSISIRSHFVNNREGIDNPFVTLVASWCLFVRYSVSCCIVSYWIDTLVLKSWGKYLL